MNWRTIVAIVLFVVSVGWPVALPILPLMGFSGGAAAAFAGVMLVAGEFLLIAAAAIAGKEGFAAIKATALGFLKRHGPPEEVSRLRYNIGLVMFFTPLVFGWAAPYLGHHIPGYETNQLAWAVGFDLVLLCSLFVLGGGFWAKLRSLFVHDAPAAAAAARAGE